MSSREVTDYEKITTLLRAMGERCRRVVGQESILLTERHLYVFDPTGEVASVYALQDLYPSTGSRD